MFFIFQDTNLMSHFRHYAGSENNHMLKKNQIAKEILGKNILCVCVADDY